MGTLRSNWIIGTATALALVSAGRAQTGSFDGRVIADIQYVPATAILAPPDLAKIQPLKKGERLRSADVAEAIDRLFATGRFADILVEAEPSGAGVIVRFVTKPEWFIGGVNVVGSIESPPNRGELTNNGQFTLGAVFREDDVTKATASMKKLLQSNGLYENQVEPSIERDDNGQQVFITFQVKEGKRAKYQAPGIEGNTLLPANTIIRATGWRLPLINIWRKVSAARTRAGVQGVLKKYQDKDRLLARVQLEGLDYAAKTRRVRPRLQVEPGPRVEVKATEAKLSKRVLKRYVPVYAERTVDTDLLVDGKRNLENYLQSQGYYDADVEFRVLPLQNDLETIEYMIARGQRYKMVHLEITGNRYFQAHTIRERMFIQPAAFNLRRGRFSEAFERKDEENIEALYKSNGFHDVKVSMAVQHDYRGKMGDVAVTVAITEGPQWLVDTLTVSGIGQLNRNSLVSSMASVAGQPFAEVNLATDRNALLTRYYESGFPSASVKVTWQMSSKPNQVNVAFAVTEGERQFVRDILTSGLHTTRPSLVNRVITLKPGDPLSPVAETEIQKRFYDLGIFARVDTAIENPDGTTAHKYILYNFDEANRYTLSVGLGAQIARFGQPSSNSLGSPSGSTGFSPQYSLNVSRLNFLGTGDTISLRGGYSSIEKLASLSYFQPRFRNVEGRNITYSLLYDQTFDVRTFASKREEASVQVTEKFSKSLTGLFRFAYRRVSTSDVIIPVLLIPQLLAPVREGIVSGNLVQDRRDNPVNPHHGMFNTGDLAIAARILGSQRSFVRVLVRNATYYRLTNNIVLARQTQFGVIAPFDAPPGLTNQESVPLPERFFGGGADSLRAFPFNEAGPRDTGAPVVPGGPSSRPTGFPLGGNALFVNNVELRFPLIGENIQGVFFHDMGNVFSTLSNISFRFNQRNLQDFDYTVHADGFGLRYKTPVGPFRVDLSYSINPPAYEGFSGTPAQLLQCNPNEPLSALPGYCQPSKQAISHFQFSISIGQTF